LSDQVWITDQRLRLLDTTFRIVTQSPYVAGEIERLLGGFERTRSAARARNIVQVTGDDGDLTAYRDCGRITTGAELPELMAAIVSNLNFAAVEECRRFAVHAGAVGWSEGTLAVPAVSGGGKTTLTAALLQAGFTFLSDEALVFDEDGGVVPYPKPLALSAWSADKLGLDHDSDTETLILPADLGSTFDAGTGKRLTDLIVSEYGYDEVRLQPLPKSQAVAALIHYSFNHFKDPARAFRIASDVARDLRVWRLEYSDPLEAAELLSETLR
jgi:hypothetical protein